LATRYVEVALDRPLSASLSYSAPPATFAELRVGSIVEVPLRSGLARGVVVALNDVRRYKGPIKPIGRILTPEFRLGAEAIELARWLADYYWCSLGEALATVSFLGLNDVRAKMKSFIELTRPEHWLSVSREVGPDDLKTTPGHRDVIHALLAASNAPMSPMELKDEAGVGDGVLQTMLKRRWLRRVEEPIFRDDEYPDEDGPPRPPPTLTEAQEAAVEAIVGAIDDRRYRTFLLHGVTGSGKTEVYLRAIERALRLGRTALVLAPEIALTPQTVAAFRARLGDLVGVYHSQMTLGQKFDLWKRIEAGQTRVLVGARSAVFAPLPDLGVIAVDEEHEGAYKQGETPRYHARDVAVWRAVRASAVAVLGSATPSLESFHNAREGKYSLLELPKRVGPHASPVMTVIDMKRHLVEGEAGAPGEGAGLLSPTLADAIELRLERGEQSILLLNRRGFANQVLCLRCEKLIQCPHCDVTLTYHKGIDKLLCHWCGHVEPLPSVCPKCGEPEIKTLGLGTQRIEELLATRFPKARVIRVDVDSMRGRRRLLDAWQKIRRGEVDIILGTQMIAKGFHLESVTLVGVVSADFALFLPDFRSAERTHHLLTQAAGRAGRGDRPGEVIVQTYIPHHYAIDAAARLDVAGFYKRELHIRAMLRFPPLTRLIAILVASEDKVLARERAGRLANILKSLANRHNFEGLNVLGAAPAPIGRIDDKHRWRILLRGPQAGALHALLRQGMATFGERVAQSSKVQITVDVDPVDLL
jgi:primosomal protein N' (replication factor Y)